MYLIEFQINCRICQMVWFLSIFRALSQLIFFKFLWKSWGLKFLKLCLYKSILLSCLSCSIGYNINWTKWSEIVVSMFPEIVSSVLSVSSKDIINEGLWYQTQMSRCCYLQNKRRWIQYQGLIQALLLTTIFHEGLSFMAVGHNPMCVCTWGFK